MNLFCLIDLGINDMNKMNLFYQMQLNLHLGGRCADDNLFCNILALSSA